MRSLVSEDNSYAIIAGGGDLPKIVCDSLSFSGKRKIVICLKNQENYGWVKDVNSYKAEVWEIDKILEILKNNRIKYVVFAGDVVRPRFSELKLSGLAVKLMGKIAKNIIKGDNKILSTIVDFIQEQGYQVIGAEEIVNSLQVSSGFVGKIKDKSHEKDLEIGKSILEKLSEYDIGQSIIVNEGRVMAIEAAEGTDSMLQRMKEINNCGGILIKLKKKGQNTKIDLPVIGPNTVDLAAKAKLKGIVIGACSVLILERSLSIELANKSNIFVRAI